MRRAFFVAYFLRVDPRVTLGLPGPDLAAWEREVDAIADAQQAALEEERR